MFKIPSLSEMRDLLIGVGKAIFPDRNYGNLRSYHARRATFLAAATTQLHSHIDSVQKDVMPNQATDGPLDEWGDIKGIIRKGATPARKASAGRVRGLNGTPVDADEELILPSSGLRYKISNATSVPAALFIDADIVAIDTGEQTKLLAGVVLEFVATPAGLETQVVLQDDLDEDGYDTEQFGAYRKRVLASFSDETSGGSQSDYVKWALELEGVSQAYAYPNRAGFGTVDLVALHTGSGAARVLSAGEVAELLAYVKTKAPAHIAGVPGALRALLVETDAQAVEIVLTPNGEAAHAFDWTDGPLTVAAWTAGTRSLQFTTDLPSTLKAGHRGCFDGVATAQDGREYTIEAISAADTVILEEAPTVAPAATDLFYSGGPLVTPIRNAILAHMNGETIYAGKNRVPLAESAVDSTVGLEVLVDGIGPANPAGVYGTWSGGLIRAVIGNIAIYKAGVRNYTIPLPAADYEAEDDVFPLDDQVHMIIPLSVLVRGAT